MSKRLTGGQIKHGHAANNRVGRKPSPEYAVWASMIARCECSSSVGFVNYGARGIKVCDRWRDSFEAFFADMGIRPPGKSGKRSVFSLEREDNDGDYGPGNCRWATRSEQSRNSRRNRWMIFGGRRMCVLDVARETGLSRSTIAHRLDRGWSDAEAVS